MKQLLMLLLMLVLSTATYNDSLSGSQTAAPESAGIALNLTASGDLPGMNKVTLQGNGQNVTGGSWRMTTKLSGTDALPSAGAVVIGCGCWLPAKSFPRNVRV